MRHFVIDYPEAQIAARRIESECGVNFSETLPALGRRPVTKEMKPHDVGAGPFIVLNGSGDFHHETVGLFDGICAARPDDKITYIQIDAHADKEDTFRWRCDCASFVGRVMKHKQLEKIFLMGLHLPQMSEPSIGTPVISRLGYFGEHYFKKIHQYVAGPRLGEHFFAYEAQDIVEANQNSTVDKVAERRAINPLAHPAKEGQEQDVLFVDWLGLDAFVVDDLPPGPIYLTIDLDVCVDRPVTDWVHKKGDENQYGVYNNQGIMEWPDVLGLVEKIGAARSIVGADVCGLTHQIENIPESAREQSLDAMVEIYRTVVKAMTP